MPIWLMIALGAGILWAVSRSTTTGNPLTPSTGNAASAFYVGQSITIPSGEIYSDSALTQDVGTYPGGTGTIKAIDLVNNSVGFVGPTGTGIGGGAPAYVSAANVTAA